MLRVNIPAYKLRLDSALLECQYELNGNDQQHQYGYHGAGSHHNYDSNEQADEGEALYSVKWYKDNEGKQPLTPPHSLSHIPNIRHLNFFSARFYFQNFTGTFRRQNRRSIATQSMVYEWM